MSESCDVKKTQPAMTGFEDGRRAKAEGCRQPLEARKDRENRVSSRDSRKERSLANTLILAL